MTINKTNLKNCNSYPQQVTENTVVIENHEERLTFIESQGEIELGAFRGGGYNETSYFTFNTTGTAQVVVDAGIDGLLGVNFEGGSREDINGDIEKGIFISGVVGVSNHYTRKETNDQLDLKSDKLDTYSKAEVDTALQTKADQSTTYTKTETDERYVPINNTLETGLVITSPVKYEVKTSTFDVTLIDIDDTPLYGLQIQGEALTIFDLQNPGVILTEITFDDFKYIQDNKRNLPLGSQFHSFSTTPLTPPANIPVGTEWQLTATIPVSAGGTVEQYTLVVSA